MRLAGHAVRPEAEARVDERDAGSLAIAAGLPVIVSRRVHESEQDADRGVHKPCMENWQNSTIGADQLDERTPSQGKTVWLADSLHTLDVEAEEQHVAVVHDVLLAFL